MFGWHRGDLAGGALVDLAEFHRATIGFALFCFFFFVPRSEGMTLPRGPDNSRGHLLLN